MISPLTYFRKIKDQQHIFIYCVLGRSSSTAFQRIINSSNLVWIWGEQHRMIDDTVALINQLKNYSGSTLVKHSLEKMYSSFANNKHLSFYPNAIGNLDTTIEVLNSAVSNLLKPWASKIKRFGFKDIEITDIKTLQYLKETYPQCYVVFCFRDPLKQWPSIQSLQDWWSYSTDINLFLAEYYRTSNIYLEFAAITKSTVFIENNDLRDHDKVAKIINYLNIPKIDTTIINVTINAAKSNLLTDADQEIILKSDAYQNYLKIKALSTSFYKSL